MRVEDERLVRGRGRFADDLNLPGQAVGWFVRSSVAHAKIARARCGAGARGAGRAARADRRRDRGRRRCEHFAASAACRTQRRRADPAAASCACENQGDACRRADRAGGCGLADGGARCGRIGRGWLRSAAARHRHHRGRRRWRAAALAAGAGQRRARLVDADGCARRRDYRRDLLSRRARRARQRRQPAYRGVVDGAARCDGDLRLPAGPLHAALLLAGRDLAARAAGRRHGRDARADRGCDRRRRRCVRHEDVGLSGIHRAADRGAADRAAGALDVGPLGSLPHRQPGARHGHRCRARARCEGQVSGAARPASGRHGRVYRRGRRQHPDDEFCALLSLRLRHSEECRSMRAASSPTRCRPGPIAAPGGPRRTMRWSGWWKRRRASAASTRSCCAGAT